jgi:hypothetical protein
MPSRPNIRCFPSSALFVLVGLLAACERKAPATGQPAATRPPAALPDTAHLVTLSPQDSIITVGPTAAKEGDVPELHNLAFDDRTTVAPGVVVSYKSIPRPDTAVVRDPCDIKIDFTIRRFGKIIYRDITDGCAYDPSLVDSAIQKVYPLWVPTSKDSGELLVLFNNRPSKDLARRFFIKSQQVIKIDTLLTFDGPAHDVDKDGKQEFSGLYDYGEVWDDGKGHYFTSYNPKLYYEIRPTGLVLDTALTRRKAIARYGVFRGFEYSDKPGIHVKQPR